MLDHALAYAADGCEVFPVSEHSKAPYSTNGMNSATTDEAQIRRWWAEHPEALIGCRIPENVVVLDIDPRHAGGRTWAELERQRGVIKSGRIHASGRNDGGRHVWFERGDLVKVSAKRLHQWAKENGVGEPTGKKGRSWTSGIDVLHHNWRYTILPPSLHPATGKPYRWITEGAPSPMPPWLAHLITPLTPQASAQEFTGTSTVDDSIADWFNENSQWVDILKGWYVVEGDGESDGSKWRHPTASAAWSASTKHGCLFVYTPNTDFEETEEGAPHGYTKFRAWAELEHDGDLKAAAREAFERRDGPPPELNLKPTTTTQAEQEDDEPPGADDDTELLGMLVNWGDFWSVDHNASDWLLEPVVAAGRSHAIFAPGGTGKSLLSLWMAVQAATGKAGLSTAPQRPINVLYLDYEMTEADLSERLGDMGYGPDDDLTRLHYALLPSLPGLDEPEGGKAVVKLAQLVEAELVVIDTFGRAVHGDENDADTVRAWYRWTGIHLKHDGRAFVRIDHAGKDLEKGQRGTSAKNDDVDVVWQMTKADAGAFNLKAKKRRMGWVPEEVKLVMRDDPLRYGLLSGLAYPAGTTDLAKVLDGLGHPVDGSARSAADALRAAGKKAENAVIRAAVKYRKEVELRLAGPVDNLWENGPENLRRGPCDETLGASGGAVRRGTENTCSDGVQPRPARSGAVPESNCGAPPLSISGALQDQPQEAVEPSIDDVF